MKCEFRLNRYMQFFFQLLFLQQQLKRNRDIVWRVETLITKFSLWRRHTKQTDIALSGHTGISSSIRRLLGRRPSFVNISLVARSLVDAVPPQNIQKYFALKKFWCAFPYYSKKNVYIVLVIEFMEIVLWSLCEFLDFDK